MNRLGFRLQSVLRKLPPTPNSIGLMKNSSHVQHLYHTRFYSHKKMVDIICNKVTPETKPLTDTTNLSFGLLESKKVEMTSKMDKNRERRLNKDYKEDEEDDHIYIKKEIHFNGFLFAVHLAYRNHYPLELKPDDIWIQIEMGVALHVNQNSEKLRSKFVTHQGKKEIVVEDHTLVMGYENSNWVPNFTKFEQAICEHIGKDKTDALVCDFSTTTSVEKVASQIVLMDTVKSYFRYSVLTLCGIPLIRLLGNKEDWLKIKSKLVKIKSMDLGLDDWLKELNLVIDKFIDAFDNKIDHTFWESFYKVIGGSGGPYINGWINIFFPYLELKSSGVVEYRRNEYCNLEKILNSDEEGPRSYSFPPGHSSVDFIWNYYGSEHKMQFYAGFFNPIQSKSTLFIKPNIEWAIVHLEKEDPKPSSTTKGDTLLSMIGRAPRN